MSILDKPHFHTYKFADLQPGVDGPTGTYLDTEVGRAKLQKDYEKLLERGKEGAFVVSCELPCLVEYRWKAPRDDDVESQAV